MTPLDSTAGSTTGSTQMTATQPRPSSATIGRLSHPGDSGSRHDPFGETVVHRAVSKSAPNPIGVVVTGDSHLGAALPGLSPARRAERHERLRRGFSAAVDYAVQHGARLFVIAGDLFDNPAPSNAERAFVAGELVRLRRANIVCVAVGGASDSAATAAGQGGESPYQPYAAMESLVYFPATGLLTPRLLTLGNLLLAVAGISTDPAAPHGSDPLAGVLVSDAEHALHDAHLGLLLVHAGIEGFARPEEDDRIVSRASLEALPPAFRIVVAGHAHRFGRARIGEREVIVPGSTERMDFDAPAGSSGFAWLEIIPDGVVRVRRITVAEQPRADVVLETSRLFPDGLMDAPGDTDPAIPAIPPLPAKAPANGASPALPVLTPDGRLAETSDDNGAGAGRSGGSNGTYSTTETEGAGARAEIEQRRDTDALLILLKQALDEVSSDETLVRLRLVGPITRAQYHLLPLRELVRYGNARTFAFELDTGGLELSEPVAAPPTGPRSTPGVALGVHRAAATTGPLSPAFEVERLLQDRLARVAPEDATAVADLQAAASILLARLRATSAPMAFSPTSPASTVPSDREADS